MLVTSIFPVSRNVFKGLHFQGHQKSGLCGKVIMTLSMRVSENIVRKGENTGKQHFLFKQCF